MKWEEVLKIIWDFFKSLKLTAINLLLLILTSIIGTLIAQKSQTQMPLEEIYSPFAFQLISYFGLGDIYHSWWFISLLVLFFINLFVCTMDHLPKIIALMKADMASVALENLSSFPTYKKFKIIDIEKLESFLKEKFPKAKTSFSPQGMQHFFIEKNYFAQINFMIVHIGILIVLIGAVINSMFGFEADLPLTKGRTESTVVVSQGEERHVILPLGFAVTLDQFFIDFYPQTERVKQYISKISVSERGEHKANAEVSVNHPFNYKDFSFYQSSYGNQPNFEFEIKVDDNKPRLVTAEYRAKTPIDEARLMLIVVDYAPNGHQENGKPEVLAHILEKMKMAPPMWFTLNEPRIIGAQSGQVTMTFTKQNENYYSVLQVSKSPGIIVIWSGFIILTLGLFLIPLYRYMRIYYIVDKEKQMLHFCQIQSRYTFTELGIYQEYKQELIQQNIISEMKEV